MINAGVSDLWFNYEKTLAEETTDKEFLGYDYTELAKIAEEFIASLALAGVDTSELNAEVLIDDFENRI